MKPRRKPSDALIAWLDEMGKLGDVALHWNEYEEKWEVWFDERPYSGYTVGEAFDAVMEDNPCL